MAQRQYLTCFMILFQHSVLLPPPFYFEEKVNFHSSLVSIHSPHVNEKQKRGWGERKAKQFLHLNMCVAFQNKHQEQQLQPSGIYFSVLGIKARLSHIQAVRLHWDPFQPSSSLCFRALLLFLKEGDVFGHKNKTHSKENTYSVNSLTFFAAYKGNRCL